MTTLLDIIKSGLIANGYDGLYCSDCCACTVDDLAPCSDGPAAQGYGKCEPGYKHTHSATGEWVIAERKKPMSDEEIQKTIDYIG